MQVTLNDERWQVSDEATVMEVLADLSERAHARQHLVMRLEIGGRVITDRDLQPLFLSKMMKEVGDVQASSQALECLYSNVHEAAEALGGQLRSEGHALAARVRLGGTEVAALDAWVGRMADYVEGATAGNRLSSTSIGELTAWLEQLLQARGQGDLVRVADLLQYEILPRLPEGNCATA